MEKKEDLESSTLGKYSWLEVKSLSLYLFFAYHSDNGGFVETVFLPANDL